jgi:hypothetical protein
MIALDYMAEMPEPVKVARVAGTIARMQCSDIRGIESDGAMLTLVPLTLRKRRLAVRMASTAQRRDDRTAELWRRWRQIGSIDCRGGAG